MNRLAILALPFAFFLTCPFAGAADTKPDDSGDLVNGQKIYQSRCTACHSIEVSVAGPAHKGVFGRKVASVADFSYSAGLKKLHAQKVIWDEKTLDQWLANPEKFSPGQEMEVSVPESKDRADLIAYLKNLK
jgi:cytochrome c